MTEKCACPSVSPRWNTTATVPKLRTGRFKQSRIGKGNVGELLVTGSGVKKNVLKGQRELFTAMLQGSDYAAYALGMDYANGNNGLPKDRQLAIQLLVQRCLNETESHHRNMDDEETATAREILKELITGRGWVIMYWLWEALNKRTKQHVPVPNRCKHFIVLRIWFIVSDKQFRI